MGLLIRIAVGLFVVISLFLVLLARVAVRPKVHTLEYELDFLKNRYEFTKNESLAIENEHTVETFDGHQIWVGLVPGNPECKRYVILSHGYKSTRYGMYKYAVLWRGAAFAG